MFEVDIYNILLFENIAIIKCLKFKIFFCATDPSTGSAICVSRKDVVAMIEMGYHPMEACDALISAGDVAVTASLLCNT